MTAPTKHNLHNRVRAPWKSRRYERDDLDAFDTLPLEIKRAVWEGMTPWSGNSCLAAIEKRGAALFAVADVVDLIRFADQRIMRAENAPDYAAVQAAPLYDRRRA